MIITKDLLSGLLFLILGLGGAAIATGYDIGTAHEMGPGYFPLLVASTIAIMGGVMIVRALADSGASPVVVVWEPRALLFITAAVLSFMLLIASAGLFAAVASLTILGCLARPGVRIAEMIGLIVVLTLLACLIFVFGLGIPLKVLP